MMLMPGYTVLAPLYGCDVSTQVDDLYHVPFTTCECADQEMQALLKTSVIVPPTNTIPAGGGMFFASNFHQDIDIFTTSETDFLYQISTPHSSNNILQKTSRYRTTPRHTITTWYNDMTADM